MLQPEVDNRGQIPELAVGVGGLRYSPWLDVRSPLMRFSCTSENLRDSKAKNWWSGSVSNHPDSWAWAQALEDVLNNVIVLARFSATFAHHFANVLCPTSQILDFQEHVWKTNGPLNFESARICWNGKQR